MTYRRETRALKGTILRGIRLELGAAERFVGQSALFRLASSLILCPNACILAVTFDDLPLANWIIALFQSWWQCAKTSPCSGFCMQGIQIFVRCSRNFKEPAGFRVVGARATDQATVRLVRQLGHYHLSVGWRTIPISLIFPRGHLGRF